MVRSFNKFAYPNIIRDETSGKRFYRTPKSDLVPSITTILDSTKDKTKLLEWRARVGNEAAEQIVTEARTIGTFMHSHLERYVLGEDVKITDTYEDRKAYKMADVIIDQGLQHLDEVWKSEVPLYYKDQYAGTTDLVGIYKGKQCIIDFKQTNKPKKAEWIQDYFLQTCAYAHAHNYLHNTEIENTVILMCSRDLKFQIFEVNDIQFPKYSYAWFNRVKDFSKLAKV